MIIQPHCFGPDVAQDGGSVWCNKASLLMVRKQKRQEKGRDHWIWHTELNVGNLWDSINIPDAVECILLWRYSFGSISMLWGNHRSNQDFIKPRSSTPTVKCAPYPSCLSGLSGHQISWPQSLPHWSGSANHSTWPDVDSSPPIF
jgi:hypothetical protein